MGAQLVQAGDILVSYWGIDKNLILGYALYNNIDVEQGEDTLITGVLRDAIGDIEVVKQM